MPAALITLLLAVPAAAQTTDDQPWEFEGFIGGVFAGGVGGGRSALPPAGQTFTTAGGRSSRQVPSWYFGDGAALLNQVISGVTGVVRLTPLDSVLSQSELTRDNGFDLGFRLGRVINPRLTAEILFDVALDPLRLSDDFGNGVEASRSSFVDAFNGLSGVGGFPNPSVSSTATMTSGSGPQIYSVGALSINLEPPDRVTPYITVGAGLVTNAGSLPTMRLTGNYRYQLPGAAPVNETDNVTMRVVGHKRDIAVLVGGGVKAVGGKSWGIRGDFRGYLSKNGFDILLDANPAVATLVPAGTAVIAPAATSLPAIQFSNNPSTGRPSSLSAPAVSGFQAFEARGYELHIIATLGYFVKF